MSKIELFRYVHMFTALGSERRLRVVRLLLAAHPEGMVVGEIQAQVGLSPSNLSHHLDKLRSEELVTVERESTFLRYRANATALQQLLGLLFAECCTRSNVVKAGAILKSC